MSKVEWKRGDRVRVKLSHPTHPGITGIVESVGNAGIYVLDEQGDLSPWHRTSLERDPDSHESFVCPTCLAEHTVGADEVCKSCQRTYGGPDPSSTCITDARQPKPSVCLGCDPQRDPARAAREGGRHTCGAMGERTQWPTRKSPPPDDWGRWLPCGCDPETGIDCDEHLREKVDRSSLDDRRTPQAKEKEE
jgi:hypothetical protein